TRLQALTRTFSLFVGAAGQWANKNLDNAEKFTLGGDKGVRAYPAAEGSSDLGALVNTELRYWVNPQWSSYAFYDWGHGRLSKTPTQPGDNTRTIHGFGLGVQYTNPELFTLKASLGFRGQERVQSEEDNPKARLLVQIQHSF
ncbi:MAG: ShlB/FhaC/HecB family hemolysin secretion/activation protein, partial [Cytophagales bacterium]|nr:ShlB/FhaC/HecB family hemolysin secretion/activation protein [Rhizobacter sp.]